VQFYICVTDQKQLDGQFTVFGRVVEGLDVATKISQLSADAKGAPNAPVVIHRVELRGLSPSDLEIADLRGLVEAPQGKIVLEFMPDKAPHSVRQFLRLARMGFYDQTTFGYVSPGYLVRGGNPGGWPADSPNHKRVFSVYPLDREASDATFEAGTLALQPHEADPNTNRFFFIIVTKDSPHLAGQYTAFARVIQGLEAVKDISYADANEQGVPTERQEITKLTLVPAADIARLAPPPPPPVVVEPEPVVEEPAAPVLSDEARQAAQAKLAQVTERPLGIPVYPGATADKKIAGHLAQYAGAGAEIHVFKHNDSLEQIRAFYIVAGLTESQAAAGDPNATTFDGPGGVQVELANPWTDLETGAEKSGTLITIIKRP
jgi:cyclophilin family peptidyl-prolyl cis-trans isomerase